MGLGRDAVPPLPAEDHVCIACDLLYADITVEDAIEAITELPRAVRRVVFGVPDRVLRQRPSSEVWCAVEYLCHLRDVYTSYTIRLHRTRTEDRPVLEPMLNELRARRFGYRGREVAGVLEELVAVTAGFRSEVGRVEDWSRVATRLPGEERTALWLVRQAMHEGVHHLADLREVTRARDPSGPGSSP